MYLLKRVAWHGQDAIFEVERREGGLRVFAAHGSAGGSGRRLRSARCSERWKRREGEGNAVAEGGREK